ncbi:hypothetical protein BSKO_14156 [Bryopsis sp. KO-2023]|nr:hypothetical protein BSKO_14156 [Bryopsis sp. KO-2023]
MKTIALAVLVFACLAQCALASVQPRKCPSGPSTNCSAVSTLQIEATIGKCRGTSSANCKEPASVYESSFVSSINTAVATAFTSASGIVCRKDGDDVTAGSLCRGEGGVDSTSRIFEERYGNFCSGLSDIPACEGLGGSTCCSLKPNARSCRFNKDPKCTGRCRRTTWRAVKAENDRKVWRDQISNVECFCKDD